VNKEHQESILFRLVKAGSKFQNYALRMSYRSFERMYFGANVICTVLVGCSCILKPDIYTAVFGCSYLLGLVLSVMALRPYVRHAFRNVLGVLLSAVAFPMILACAIPRIANGSADRLLAGLFCFALLYFVIISIYLVNWYVAIPLVKAGGLPALVKLQLYRIKRKAVLIAEEKQWNDTAIVRMNPVTWQKASHDERIAYIEQVFLVEAANQELTEPVYLYRLTSGQSIHTVLEFTIDPGNHRLLWDEDAVDWWPMEDIIQQLIMGLQEYRWFFTLTMQEKLEMQSNKDMVYLRCQQFNSSASTLTFDLITGYYAIVRADWYCLNE